MHELMNYVCDELSELEKKASKGGKLTMAEIDYADKLAHLKKNLLRADELMDEGYSSAGYYPGRVYSGSYTRRDSRGRYASDSDYRYSRDGYAMDDESIVQELKELMHRAPDNKKQRFQRFISEMEQM